MAIYLVIALLAVIVLLLCVPMRQRPHLLGYLLKVAVVVIAFYYLGPIVLAFVLEAYTSVVERCGRTTTFALMGGCVALLIFFWAWRSDRKSNAAIRAGSIEAFNERVEELKTGPLNYSDDEAVAAVTRLRDGKD
ncbi:MAG TPA: hypothetical protein VK638_30945 [Edaphobacter sp.]|nr:hypothetical protein [Edaphobacter sp.]